VLRVFPLIHRQAGFGLPRPMPALLAMRGTSVSATAMSTASSDGSGFFYFKKSASSQG